MTQAASLFQASVDSGAMSAAAAAVVVPDFTASVRLALGKPAKDVKASSGFVVGALLDNSGSMDRWDTDVSGGKTHTMTLACEQVNFFFDSMKDSKEKDGLRGRVTLFDRDICPFVELSAIPRLNTTIAPPVTGTPLLDSMAKDLAAVMAKIEEFADCGSQARGVFLIITDGAEIHSVHHRTPASIRPLVEAANATEQILIMAIGISDGRTDFRAFFQACGLHDHLIWTPGRTASEMRAAVGAASLSMVRASQADFGANMSQAAQASSTNGASQSAGGGF